MALEKISDYKRRKYAAGSRPSNQTIINWIKAGKLYGEQRGEGGTWWVDETVSVVNRPVSRPARTGNDIADKILRELQHARG